MKQVDTIRRDNLFILIEMHDGTITSVADATGVARTTLSGVTHDKPMLSKHARQIEMALEKPFGWMDLVHEEEELSPHYAKDVLRAAVECIYSATKITKLYTALNTDGKVDFLDKLYHLFTDPAARELSPKTILRMLGVDDEIKDKNKRQVGRIKDDIK